MDKKKKKELRMKLNIMLCLYSELNLASESGRSLMVEKVLQILEREEEKQKEEQIKCNQKERYREAY